MQQSQPLIWAKLQPENRFSTLVRDSNAEICRALMIAYRIGNDAVSAVGDCKQKLFKEVWLDGKKVAQQMRPQSEALRRVLAKACKR